MNRHGCPTDRELEQYLDGELDRDLARWIEEHLDHCTSCRLTYAAICAEV